MAHKPYYNAAGDKVPSVTTITGRFKDSGGLIWWANAVGLGEHDSCRDQERCGHCGRRAGRKQYEASAFAADVGSFAHDLIEEHIKGVPVDHGEWTHLSDAQNSQAEECLTAFKRWIDNFGVDIIETELALVSEEHQFGGRIDSIGRLADGKLILPDWKTSANLYGDYLSQIAGYGILVNESDLFGEVEEYHILRVSKESAAFHHSSWTAAKFKPAIEHFMQARKLFDNVKALDKMLK